MALNPLIPLSGQNPDYSKPFVNRRREQQRRQEQNQLMGLRERELGLAENQEERLQRAAEREFDEDEFKSMAIGAAQAKRFLDEGNMQGLRQFIADRTKRIVGRGGNPQDTLELGKLINAGEVDRARDLLDSTIQAGQLRGALPAEAGVPQLIGGETAERLGFAPGTMVQMTPDGFEVIQQPQKADSGSVERVLGPDGQPALARITPQGAEIIEGVQPLPSGISLETSPDGGVRFSTGTQSVSSGTKGKLEESISTTNEGLSRLFEMQNSFKPEFLTYGGKISAALSSVKDKINPESLSANERQALQEYTQFTTNAIGNMNRYIKEITGAQMSEQEAERIRKGIPDPENDGPTVFKAKMDTNMRQLALARARSIHAMRQGVTGNPWDVVSLDGMEDVINKRADDLTQQFQSSGMEQQRARQEALQQTRQEFGL